MKTHILVANALVLVASSHGAMLREREGREEMGTTLDGVELQPRTIFNHIEVPSQNRILMESDDDNSYITHTVYRVDDYGLGVWPKKPITGSFPSDSESEDREPGNAKRKDKHVVSKPDETKPQDKHVVQVPVKSEQQDDSADSPKHAGGSCFSLCSFKRFLLIK
ncbi:unnamed protein product [Albugo candida]|uniref:RxLR effector protein n=1 Tax=Albugo candida TaxID=65357 RepID=A0A024FXM0_9STRA|nr:unnamed protein product [Albugo candida]|eukprot:CCI11657.1 unnamed protein product [Albugo candida]